MQNQLFPGGKVLFQGAVCKLAENEEFKQTFRTSLSSSEKNARIYMIQVFLKFCGELYGIKLEIKNQESQFG